MKYHKKRTRIYSRVEYLFVDPNETLIGTILPDLGVHFRPAVMKDQATLLMSVREGIGVPLFSPHARTHKFELAKRLIETERFHGPRSKWLKRQVGDPLDQHEPSGKIMRTILDKYDVAIRSQHLRRSRIAGAP